MDEATQRRIVMLSEMHSRWQQLQDDIASDAGEYGLSSNDIIQIQIPYCLSLQVQDIQTSFGVGCFNYRAF